MLSKDQIEARLRTRFKQWGPMVAVPDRWLPYLLELDEAVAAILPDYELAQVKEKFGTLRYYLELPVEPPCCQEFERAHPYPGSGSSSSDELSALVAWEAARDAHEATAAHLEQEADHAARTERAQALVTLSEVASGRW